MTDRLLRMSEIVKLTGVRRETINKRVRRGAFPAPRKMGYAIAWLESDINAWMQNLPSATYKKAEG